MYLSHQRQIKLLFKVEIGDPVTFVFSNGTKTIVPYTGNYHSPIADKFLKDIFAPYLIVPFKNPCWGTFRNSDGGVISIHFANCIGGGA